MTQRELSDLTIVSWNPYIGNEPENVLDVLDDWAGVYRPHVIQLSEAARVADLLRRHAGELGTGYALFQRTPVKATAKLIDEAGDVALLVRRDVTVRSHRVAVMRTPWHGPKHGTPHTPREDEIVTILTPRGVVAKVRATHTVTGGTTGRNRVAYLEQTARQRTWAAGVAARHPKRLLVVVGDQNTSKAKLAEIYGDRYKVVGDGPDLLVGRNADTIGTAELPKHGSDHHGRVYYVDAAY